MSRGRPSPAPETPERRCIATGASGPRARLVRFVVGPGGQLARFGGGKGGGRGIWLSADRAAFDLAVRRNLFSRAARAPVVVPEGLADFVEGLLARRMTDLLGLARKAGEALAGYETVRAALMAEKVSVLVQACDGSPRQRARLRPPDGSGTLIDVLTGSEIGLAFGRENVIHAALTGGGLTARIVEEAPRLAGLREIHAPERAIPGKGAGEQTGNRTR
ncbi:MAG: RNA-binding protein [Rhodobacteraceae bacterium]|nr:RNA-binding protein [Paracoccaceae bacterium]